MMRYIFVILLAAIGVSGCYKDKGNYSYHAINDIVIQTADSVSSLFGDTLKITPVIVQAIAADESRLKFEWSVLVSGGSTPGTTIGSSEDSSSVVLSTARNLDMVLNLPTQATYYSLNYRVTDTVTGVTYRKLIKLLLYSKYQVGWMLLEQGQGGTDISFLNTVQDTLYRHLFSTVNPDEPLPSSASSVYAFNLPSAKNTTSSFANATFPAQTFCAVFYGTGGYVIDASTFKVSSGFGALFSSAPAPMQPQYMEMDAAPNIVAINAGQLYRRFETLGSLLFNQAFTTYDGQDYFLAPFCANSPHTTCYFDTLHRRFLTEVSKTTLLDSCNYYEGYSAFDPRNLTGRSVLGMGLGFYGQFQYAVMRNTGGDSSFLYCLQFGNPVFARTLLNSPGINGSPAFLFTTTRNQMYYASGNNVYLYDISGDASNIIYSFPSGENITTMAMPDDNDLLVATFNGNVGSLYFFSFDGSGNINNGTYTTSYTGFGKVVSMAYHN